MSLPSEALYEAAEELLGGCIVALGDSLAGPPPYSTIWHGQPTFDCDEALYVNVGAENLADANGGSPQLQALSRLKTTAQVNLAAFQITVTRCVPGLQEQGQNILLPDAAAVAEASRIVYSDFWAIWNGLKNQNRAGLLFATPSNRRFFDLLNAVPLNNSGGVGGWIITVVVEMPGYGADAS